MDYMSRTQYVDYLFRELDNRKEDMIKDTVIRVWCGGETEDIIVEFWLHGENIFKYHVSLIDLMYLKMPELSIQQIIDEYKKRVE